MKALAKVGFYFVRRSKETHIYLRRDSPLTFVAVPDHKVIKPGTLKSILWQAGLTVDEFNELL